MKAGGGGEPTGAVADLINSSFGSYAAFRAEFDTASNTAFGSGWAWLVWTPSGLKVTKTTGADTPIAEEGTVPILTLVRASFNCKFSCSCDVKSQYSHLRAPNFC